MSTGNRIGMSDRADILQYQQNIVTATFDKYIRFFLPISNFKVLWSNFKIQLCFQRKAKVSDYNINVLNLHMQNS